MKVEPFKIIPAVLALALLSAWPAAGGGAVARSRGQSLYVPVYSHIYSGDREQPFYLAVTLSIRNTDPRVQISLTQVDYHDGDGQRLRRYLDAPKTLAPLAATRYVIGERDKTGGSGANFIVQWTAAEPATAPIVESVMIGTQTQQGISFTSRGQIIAETGD